MSNLLAIVEDGKVVHAKGYGVRRLGANADPAASLGVGAPQFCGGTPRPERGR